MSTQLDVNNVIKHIELLYTSKDASQINLVQEQLQQFQKHEHSYELGIELLKNQNNQVRYFGALTITVYLNTYGSNEFLIKFKELSYNVQQLMQENFNGNLFIIRKLLSNLSNIYIQNFENIDPILAFISILTKNENESVQNFLLNLSDLKQIQVLILFFEILAEEIQKLITFSPELHLLIHQSLFLHLLKLYDFLLNQYSNLSTDTLLLSLDCLSAWVIYISKAEARSEQRYTNDLNLLITFTMKKLGEDFDVEKMESYNKTFTVVTEFIDNIPRVINPFKSKLSEIFFGTGNFGITFLNSIFSDQDLLEEYRMEIDNYINLLVNFLDSNIIHMTRHLLDESTYNILKTLIALTDANGRPIIDENISFQLISFWEDFCNTLIDDEDVIKEILHNDQKSIDEYNQRRTSILMEVAVIYFKKIQRFSNETTQEFTRYRTVVSDLFILFYTLLGIPLFATICDSIGSDLIISEAAIYLLHKITVDIRFYDDEDDDDTRNMPLINQFDNLFSKNLLELIKNNLRDQHITISLLNLMSILPFFYKSEAGNKYLASSFEFLFDIINNNPDERLSLIASKTVFKICQNAENKLIPFLPQLELILAEMLRNQTIDGLIRERITFSYMSIVRSQKNQKELGDKIFAILQIIIQQKQHVNEEHNEDYVTSLIACINEIGKACQYPEEIEDYFNPTQLEEFKSYWSVDPLNIRSLILESLKIFSLDSDFLSQNTIVTEKCCYILKSGLNETIPGPFTFNLNLIFQYIIAKASRSNTASIDYIHQLLISVILTNFKLIEPVQLEQVLTKVILDIESMIKLDEDLIKSSLDVFTSIIELKPSLLIYSSDIFNYILQFALNAFVKSETSIIKSTIKFWNTLAVLKKGNQKDQEYIRNFITNDSTGTSLGFKLIENLTLAFILSPRSNLDYYYPLLRTFISKYSIEFKKWVSVVLETNQVGKDSLTKDEINQFIGKLMLTRGQRVANNVLKEFWLKINKLVEY